jgi:hypothetical protein
MTEDSIIDEVRAIRDEIARERDYDINAISGALRQMEAAGKGHHVTLARREVPEPRSVNAAELANPASTSRCR